MIKEFPNNTFKESFDDDPIIYLDRVFLHKNKTPSRSKTIEISSGLYVISSVLIEKGFAFFVGSDFLYVD